MWRGGGEKGGEKETKKGTREANKEQQSNNEQEARDYTKHSIPTTNCTPTAKSQLMRKKIVDETD